MKTLNKLNKTLIALATGAMLTTGANAAVNYGNTNMGQAYIGAKTGQFVIDSDGVDADNAISYGVYAGYDFGQGFGTELEYMTSTDTDYTVSDGEKGEFSAETMGVYGTYRYNFPNSGLYAKGKLGFAQASFDIDDNDSIDDTGFAGGLGLGLDINSNFSIEGEYSRLATIENDGADIDTDLMTIGAHLKF